MSDQLRTDQLKSGDWIKNRHPVRGFPWQRVEEVRQIDPGTDVAIYRIVFTGSGFDLVANGDRVFEVEHSEPDEMVAIRSGLFVPQDN